MLGLVLAIKLVLEVALGNRLKSQRLGLGLNLNPEDRHSS